MPSIQIRFLNLLKNKHSKDNVVVIGHGFFLLYLILNALKLDLNEGKYFQLSNATVSTLELRKGKVIDYHINDYNHLIAEALKKKDG